MKDYQRQAVYDAEDSCSFWLQGEYFSEKQADELITRISKWAKIEKPEAQFNAVDKDGNEKVGRYGLGYPEFTAPLIKAVQELSAKVESLEAELAALKSS